MAKNRDRQKYNKRVKEELDNLEHLNASRIYDPTAYKAAKHITIEKFAKNKKEYEAKKDDK